MDKDPRRAPSGRWPHAQCTGPDCNGALQGGASRRTVLHPEPIKRFKIARKRTMLLLDGEATADYTGDRKHLLESPNQQLIS